MDRLTALTAFVAVADQRGFAGAARKLRLSPSRVTRLVAGLEDHLGVRLLSRTTRTVTVTDAGSRFLERARRIVADLTDAEESARRERARPSGKLTLTAPAMFGAMHVAPAVADFLDAWPELDADLQLSDRPVNLVEDGLDLAVRIGALSDSAMVVRRVGAVRRVLVAAPKYLRAAKALARPEDLARHALIAFTALAPGQHWDFASGAVAVRARATTNSGDAAIALALRGAGLTLALSYQVAAHVRDGKLRIALEDHEPPELPIHLVWPTSRLLSAKVRAFVEHVAAHCRWDFTRC